MAFTTLLSNSPMYDSITSYQSSHAPFADAPSTPSFAHTFVSINPVD